MINFKDKACIIMSTRSLGMKDIYEYNEMLLNCVCGINNFVQTTATRHYVFLHLK